METACPKSSRVAPGPIASRSVASRSVASRSVASRSVASRAVASRAVASRMVTARAFASPAHGAIARTLINLHERPPSLDGHSIHPLDHGVGNATRDLDRRVPLAHIHATKLAARDACLVRDGAN